MGTMDREKVQMECPGCKRPLEAIYYDIFSRREVKCNRCGSSLKFDFSSASQVHSAITDLERAQEKLEKAIQEAIHRAELTIKKR